MYSWDPNPRDWKGSTRYKYDSAKNPYLDKVVKDAAAKGPRTYTKHASPGKLVDARGKVISTESENPIIIRLDVTGSMDKAPGEFLDRAPLIYMTLAQYRPDVEISFGAVGDATCDEYPLQINHFGKGGDLEDHLKAIGCEGRGGGQISESYELCGYFDLNHVKTPKAKSPFLFIFGDEKFYNQVSPTQVAHYIGDRLEAPIPADQVWKGLLQRFNLYFLQKKYGYGDEPAIDEQVREHWAHAIGSQRVRLVPNMERAVDVIIGLVAKDWGEYKDFKENLSARQPDPAVREEVYESIRYVGDKDATKSRVTASRKSGKTTSLSEMYSGAKSR